MSNFLGELEWRGLIHQTTDREGLEAHFASGTRRVYSGFDPTADSLTIGNLVGIMMQRHLQLCGHESCILMGGGTGLIGDPSGKSDERQLMTLETVAANVESQRRIFESLLDFEGGRARIVNNLDWLGKINYIEALRDIGKHFSVNMMIQKESVKERLTNREQGISYTEFSYMILQAYDFLHLYREDGVTVQMGGSDQWGNIVAGGDLIRRCCDDAETFGLTSPLVTKADGGKFGKTETGAIWLTVERTSPYAYYQFWMNASDDDVEPWLRIFTLLGREELESLIAEHRADPGRRTAQRRLAQEATALLHGPTERDRAEAATKALFSGEVSGLDEDILRQVFADVPASTHDKTLLSGEGCAVLDILADTDLAQSKRQAREFLSNGAVSMNGRKIGLDDRLTTNDLLHGTMIALRRGRKSWHVARFE